VSTFAAALARTDQGWTGVELDLSEVDDLESLTDLLRDLTGDGPGPALLLLEEDEEHLAIVRVDGGAAGLDDPRVFVSDRRAVEASENVGMLYDDLDPPREDEDEDEEAPRTLAEPVGDSDLLADLGTPAADLLELCAEKGLLPGDVLAEVCERAGCAPQLEALREA